MKSTGVIRRIDDLGRIVIPKEIRKNLKIREGDTLEFYISGNEIILKLTVSQDDMGKVIGKQGRIAKAIRTVVKSAANRENVKVSLEIV